MKASVYVGIDVGATAVKCIVLSNGEEVLGKRYISHECRVRETIERVITDLAAGFRGDDIFLCFTGQGGTDIAASLGGHYVNEREALLAYLRHFHIDADNVIEIGGESAKLTYLKPKKDQRINRLCAGGTGAFLDNMARLLGTDTAGLDALAAAGEKVYPIASRCGVFAKTDVQGLLNEGAERSDLALSLFHAVTHQVLSGLSQGRPVTGKVMFLGGPPAFLPTLGKCFEKALSLTEETKLFREDGEYYLAWGAAALATEAKVMSAEELGARISAINAITSSVEMTEGLFDSEEEYKDFIKRHAKATVKRSLLADHNGAVWMGIDAGSTTLKAVLVGEDGAILKEWYGSHRGDVIFHAKEVLLSMYESLPSGCYLAGVGVTGYGEGLLLSAFRLDMGMVETMAHLRAARYFCPKVTALLDIGGQDMKYCQLKEGRISRISLNGVCSSGCGSFLETFAENLHMDIREFAKKAALAKEMPDLGRHCTVIMNSHVKKVQNSGVGMDGLAAALCVSVIRNALFGVIQLESAEELGDHVVTEGGTFYNDAVLRAFEKLTGKEAIRPDIAGLMGAYGVALAAGDQFAPSHISSALTPAEIRSFSMKGENRNCPGCGNHCVVNVRRFSNGEVFVTGNRCETGEIIFTRKNRAEKNRIPDIYQWVRKNVFRRMEVQGECRGTVGIPAVLDMWSDFPFWAGFWNALGYRVVVSEWNEKDMEKASMTIPRRVNCYPCILAHGHLQNLLRRKPDLIWYPARKRGWENKCTDEKRHALYGHVLAKFMKKQIKEAGVWYLHPTLPEFGEERLLQVLTRRLPQFAKEEIEKAVNAGYVLLEQYEKAYKEETERVLSWLRENHQPGFVFTGKSCFADVQINKGVPYIATSLGVPVLSGEGIALLTKENPLGGARSLSCVLHKACEGVMQEDNLELIAVRSVSCGVDRAVNKAVEERLREKGKAFTALSLDQGMNAGAVKIRLRTLLAEMGERGLL